jgi:hypothetical protein
MEQQPLALTPAEQMRRIRQAVYSSDSAAQQEARAALATYFARLDVLRKQMVELETKMQVREQPFVSNAPVIGPLIVGLRSLWNWMSTKWYVLPLLQQQNEFNQSVTLALCEMVNSIDILARAAQDLQLRLGEAPQSDAAREQE